MARPYWVLLGLEYSHIETVGREVKMKQKELNQNCSSGGIYFRLL